MRKGIFERAYLNWHYRKDILMKDISERAFPKGHFDEGHFEGRAFPKGERAKGMKGIVHKLEFPPGFTHICTGYFLTLMRAEKIATKPNWL